MKLSDWESGRAVDLAVGRELELRLGANPNTGYFWVWADSAGSLLQRIEPPTFERATDAIGGGGAQVWRFRAATAGTGSLRMVYRRPMQSDLSEREVRYVVIVK
jgi:inhibitor of cysteine peptidase